jgi:hypothetical protein
MTKTLSILALSLASCAFAHASPSIYNPSAAEIVKIDNEPSHRLALTGKSLRVFDVLFRPGTQSLWHSHSNDSVLVTLDGANVPSDTPGKERVARPPLASGYIYYKDYLAAPFVHRVSNEDTKDFHILDVEILPSSPLGLKLPPLEAGVRSAVIDNDRVRVSKTVIAPGQAISSLQFSGSRLYVSMTDGDFAVASNNGGEVSIRAKRGQYFINELPAAEIIRNTGASALEMVFIEVK